MTLDFDYTRTQPPTAFLGTSRPGARVTLAVPRHYPGVALEVLPCGSSNLLMLRHLRGYFGVGLGVLDSPKGIADLPRL